MLRRILGLHPRLAAYRRRRSLATSNSSAASRTDGIVFSSELKMYENTPIPNAINNRATGQITGFISNLRHVRYVAMYIARITDGTIAIADSMTRRIIRAVSADSRPPALSSCAPSEVRLGRLPSELVGLLLQVSCTDCTDTRGRSLTSTRRSEAFQVASNRTSRICVADDWIENYQARRSETYLESARKAGGAAKRGAFSVRR